MGNPSAAHEPSMEEILASIRQIISEDGEQANEAAESQPGGDTAAMSVAEPAEDHAASEPESVGELANDFSEIVEAQAPIAAAPSMPPEIHQPHRPEATLRRPSASSPQAQDAQQSQPSAAAVQRPSAPTSPSLPAAPSSEERRLLSPKADASVSGAFSALAHTILAQNARTLEDLVSEMLRPMLKDWLDDNLPPLVERLVKEEIERVSRGRH